MANITIPNLPAATAITGSFLLESVTAPSGGTSVRITVDQIAAYTGNLYGLTAIPTNTLLGNVSGVASIPVANTLTAYMDAAFGTTQGLVLYRGATNWQALAPGLDGKVLQTHGVGADPTWYAIPSSIGGGTVTQINTSGNITGGPINVTGTIGIVNNPTFSTSVTSPIIYGGTGTGSTLTLVSTSGGGVTDSINFAVGTAGGTLAFTIDTTGSLYGNLSNGQRLYGDFSNATVTNRFAFKTSTLNSSTGIYALPNGTSQASSWQAANNSDPTNASKILIATNGTTDVQLVSGINGTGTYLPLSVFNGGLGRFVFGTSGQFGIGPLASVSYGTSGQAFISGGNAAAPSWGTLSVGGGGTGATSFTQYGVLYGNATGAIQVTAVGATGQVLIGNTGAAPSWSAATSVAVTSINFGTTGLTPSTATQGAVTVAGTLVAANGGTGQSTYAVGDILYASTTTALSKLADVATGNALISGGVNTAPSWGKIGLTTHVSGTLPVGNGGTGLTTYAVGDILYASGTTTLASLADVATGSVLVSGGVGAAPAWSASPTVTTLNATTVTTTVGSFQNMVVLTAGASWSLPAALQVANAKFRITVIGGGGAGGGNPATAATAGGGGGAGGVSIAYLTYVAGQNSVTTSFGSAGTGSSGAIGGSGTDTTATYNSLTYIGKGGAGGALGAATSAGGAGGSATTGSTGTVTLALAGQTGGAGGTTTAVAGVTYINNSGGSTAYNFGIGGIMPFNAATGVAGTNGTGYGAGGSGSVAGSTATARAGGNGTAGAIIIEY